MRDLSAKIIKQGTITHLVGEKTGRESASEGRKPESGLNSLNKWWQYERKEDWVSQDSTQHRTPLPPFIEKLQAELAPTGRDLSLCSACAAGYSIIA